MSDQNYSDLPCFLVPQHNKRKIICKLSLMKSFQRSEENKHAISYSRNVHINPCLKKNQGGSACVSFKNNSPTFSGHFNFFTSSLLFSKSQTLCDFKHQTCFSCCKLKVKEMDSKVLWSIISNSREEWYLQPVTFDP